MLWPYWFSLHRESRKLLSESLPSFPRYDVVVVGGGHAGCEAAHASSRVGCSTLLITHDRSKIGEMSCNPSFGGIGKGHLIKEVDALDGVCGRICDMSGIHYKVLNRSKGPAVWGPRAQIERSLYKEHMQREMFNTKNLTILEGCVDDLVIAGVDCMDSHITADAKYNCGGVILEDGKRIESSCVILTAGTFLRGVIHIGMQRWEAGRIGEKSSKRLAQTVEDLGFQIGRLKTGTPPRLKADSVNTSVMVEWKPDEFSHPFSFMNDEVWLPVNRQVSCFTTKTGSPLKSKILDTLHLNAHVAEEVKGPRYCPSIESKILKFPNRSHTLWIEPEELDTKIVYLQGFSCTMPEKSQCEAVRTIQGLENAEISKPGYGVEYDYMDPRQITPALETKLVQSLFFAGQINGTTGYEEAAAQGIIAGINAARRAKNLIPFYVNRSDGYIGVLIDDLTTHGTNEPYRMFTSRAEYRLSLRPDNADERLTIKAFHEAGCVSEQRKIHMENTLHIVENAVDILKATRKSRSEWGRVIDENLLSFSSPNKSAFELLAYAGINKQTIFNHLSDDLTSLTKYPLLCERVSTLALYSHLQDHQQYEIEQLRKEERLLIPRDIDYSKLNVKVEICEKLARSQPINIAAASRIQGMTPAALIQIINHVKRLKNT